MSVLLSRNGQILAMCCLIVGSVLPSVRSRYNFRQNDQIWPTFAIITLNGEYVFIYSMNWISLFVCYIPCAQQVTAVSHEFVLTLKIYKKKKKRKKEKALVFLMSMQTLFLKLFPQLTMAK